MAKYTVEDLNQIMQNFADTCAMPGGALIVNKGGEEVFRGKWGFGNPALGIPEDYNTICRLASMSKLVTATAVMQLVEQGKIGLDDNLSKYIPGFENPVVFPLYIHATGWYQPSEEFPEGMSQPELIQKAMSIPPVPANRQVTIRDLLSHASGMGMGGLGDGYVYSTQTTQDVLADRVERWKNLPLDFQPGTDTGYSGVVAFDTLGRVIEVVSGLSLAEYFKKNIFEPLGIKDMFFVPETDEQRSRMVDRYFADNGKLYTGTDIAMAPINELMEVAVNAENAGYYSGAAGLWGSVEEYNKIAMMYANEGELNGVRLLKPETVKLMHTQAQEKHMEPVSVGQLGCVWGLGFIIFEQAEKMKAFAKPGTFGWSGAFGTYVLIEPESKLTMTFVTSITNAGGNLCPISNKVEELVFDIWG